VTPSSRLIHMIYDNFHAWLGHYQLSLILYQASMHLFDRFKRLWCNLFHKKLVIMMKFSSGVSSSIKDDVNRILIYTMLTVTRTILLFWNLYRTLVLSADIWRGIFSLINAFFDNVMWVLGLCTLQGSHEFLSTPPSLKVYKVYVFRYLERGLGILECQ
jgi:hypothetical protein